jgi:hypothetical protein
MVQSFGQSRTTLGRAFMLPVIRTGFAIAAASGLVMLGRPALAQTSVGTVTACYFSAECTYTASIGLSGVVDGPAFEFTNTGRTAIRGASFTINGNKKLAVVRSVYKIGTIKPGASVVVVPGYSNDGKTHAAGTFFYYSDSVLDTSDSGPDSNSIVFVFKGKIGSTAVSSGNILVGASEGPSEDGSVAELNFLGGPDGEDGPCNDCFAPKVVANITTAGGAALPPLEKGLTK